MWSRARSVHAFWPLCSLLFLVEFFRPILGLFNLKFSCSFVFRGQNGQIEFFRKLHRQNKAPHQQKPRLESRYIQTILILTTTHLPMVLTLLRWPQRWPPYLICLQGVTHAYYHGTLARYYHGDITATRRQRPPQQSSPTTTTMPLQRKVSDDTTLRPYDEDDVP